MTTKDTAKPAEPMSTEKPIPLERAVELYTLMLWWEAAHAHIPRMVH